MKSNTINNRYKILKKLGTGGMGSVYKVQELTNERIVALKVLSSEEEDRSAIQRFKQEFSLMTKLHHLNLVEVYDFGSIQHPPSRTLPPEYFFTMEYVDGIDIFKATEGMMGTRPSDNAIIWNSLYSLIVQICQALEYIHSRGLIHYDIKPGNILIITSKEKEDKNSNHPRFKVKLVDFGLAKELSTKTGVIIRGTPEYIPPEIIKGVQIDRRADLYSLGCVLYHVFTRKPPYEGDSIASVLKQHIDEASRPPRTMNNDIPEPLQKITLRLLEKEPSDRFQTANEVIREINRLTGKKFLIETEKTKEAYILSGKFVGRKRELNVLKETYQSIASLISHHHSLILVSGEVGVGKSRLIQEFKHWVQLQGGRFFSGRCYESGGVPYQGFVNILCELIRLLNYPSGRQAPIPQYIPYLTQVLPSSLFPHSSSHIPPPQSPSQEKIRLISNLSKFILSNINPQCSMPDSVKPKSSVQHPASVFTIEDLQWADEGTIGLLEYLGRSLSLTPNSYLLLCGTYQTEGLSENEALFKSINRMREDDYFKEIDLKPLTKEDTFLLISSIFKNPKVKIPYLSSLITHLYSDTQGNPFFIEEILKTLSAEGTIRRENDTWQISLDSIVKTKTPSTIEEAILRRLKNFDAQTLSVLNAVSVLNREFNLDIFKQIVPSKRIQEILVKLRQANILVERFSNNRYLYDFSHRKMAEILYNKLTSSQKVKLHRRIGNILERLYQGKETEVLNELAIHFLRGKSRSKAIHYGMEAAKRNEKFYAYRRVIQIYEQLLELLGDGKKEVAVKIARRLAGAQARVGLYQEALTTYKKILPALKNGELGEVYLMMSGIYSMLNKYKKSSEFLRRAEKTKVDYSSIMEAKARLYMAQGQYKDALKVCTLALQKGKRRCKFYGMMGGLYLYQGNLEEGLGFFKKYHDCAKEKKDRIYQAAALMNIGVIYAEKHKYSQAIRYYKQALKLGEEIGDIERIQMATNNLGNAYKDTGNYPLAIQCLEKSLLLAKKLLRKEAIGGILLNLGSTYSNSGDYSRALHYYRKSLEIFEKVGTPFDRTAVYADLHNFFLIMRDIEKSKKWAQKGVELAEKYNIASYGGVCYLGLAHIAREEKEYNRANSYIKKAKEKFRILRNETQMCKAVLEETNLNLEKKNLERAKRSIKEALAISKNVDSDEVLCRLYLTKGISTKSYTQRMGWYKKAEKILERLKNPELAWQIYYHLGEHYYEKKKLSESLQYYRKCIAIFKKICHNIDSEKLKQSYMRDSTKQKIINRIKEIRALFF